MKRLATVTGICASFLLSAALTALAQDGHQDERPADRPAAAPQQPRQDQRQEQARPEEPRQQEQARPEDRRNQEPESGNRKNTTPEKEQRQPQDQQSGDRHMQGRETHDNGRTYEGRRENGQQEGNRHAANARRIPDQEFRAHFGREHRFAPGRMQEYEGRPSFSYGGYMFEVVDGWPMGWGYDDDDYYVDYMDGDYWLYNTLYPGVRVMVIILG